MAGTLTPVIRARITQTITTMKTNKQIDMMEAGYRVKNALRRAAKQDDLEAAAKSAFQDEQSRRAFVVGAKYMHGVIKAAYDE